MRCFLGEIREKKNKRDYSNALPTAKLFNHNNLILRNFP
jgi:hypothetical protein